MTGWTRKPEETRVYEIHETEVAIIGHPNVGRRISAFLNRLTGAERSIVSPIPGTTRDAVDVDRRHNGK